tara:strand:- start:850 stop:1128 length:279 start_codon:yes stop_codon:yes gene_type:complete
MILTEEERKLEEAFQKYKALAVPAVASPEVVAEVRQAFFAGAAALYGGFMQAMGPGKKPSKSELNSVKNLGSELQEFGHALDEKVLGKMQKH